MAMPEQEVKVARWIQAGIMRGIAPCRNVGRNTNGVPAQSCTGMLE